MCSNSRCGPAQLDQRARDEHLAARGARAHPRREVDLAAVVVAVAVERQALVDADARQRALALQLLEADRPVEQRRRVGGDDHHLVADRLDDAGVVGQRVGDRLDEALDDVDRLVLPRLLGQARVAREVGEGDRHAQAAEVEVGVRVDLELHVADHVLVEEVLEEALVDAVHDRRGEREQVAREALHLLRHLEVVDALVDQRLVDVEVEELHLGVGDPRQRLPVHAHELEEGDEREAGLQRRGDVAQQLEVVLGDLGERRHREADGAPDPLDQRRLEAARLGRLLERVGLRARREEVLDEAVGEPARARRLADLVHRVAAGAQAADDPGVRERAARPLAVGQRHEAVGHPAAQRGGRDLELAGGVGEAHVRPTLPGPGQRKSGGTAVVVPPPAGNAARCLGRRRSSKATPCEGLNPSLPGLLPWLVRGGLLLARGACQTRPGDQTFRCGYSLSTSAR